MKMKYILTALLLLLTASFISAEEPNSFSAAFHRPLDLWINGEIDSDLLFEEMNRLEILLEQKGDTWENLYWRGRTALVRGQIHYEKEDTKLSLKELEKSQKLAERSIRIQENSDSWRIMAEGSSLIMLQKGIDYIIFNFSKSQDQAKKALQIDPRNARASLVIAQFLCNAPGIAGGNIDEGIKLLKKLSNRPDLIDEDRFFILLTLSETLQKVNKTDDAVMACRDALKIFPGNRKGQKLLKDLQNR